MLFGILIIIFTLLLISKRWKSRRFDIVRKELKNEFVSLPIIGHAYMFVGSEESRMQSIQKFARSALNNRHGITGLWLGSFFTAVISNAEIAELVLKMCLDKQNLRRFAYNLIGNGNLFAPYMSKLVLPFSVSIWRRRRRMLSPVFALKHLNKFVEIFARQSQMVVDKLKLKCDQPVHICHFFVMYTLDSVCETSLGIHVQALNLPNDPVPMAFIQYLQLTSERLFQPWFYSDFVYKMMPQYTKMSKSIHILHDFFNTAIKAKRIEWKQKKRIEDNDDRTNAKSFFELLIESSGGEEGYTDDELREEMLVMMLAGTDTSAIGASFVAVMLSRHPDIQEKVYQDSAMINVWAVHRDPRCWGPDAQEFRPDRFLNGPSRYPSSYLCFSFGPRNCPGYLYALMSMKTLLGTIVRSYHLQPVLSPGDDLSKPLRVKFDLMMRHAEDFPIRITPRHKL